jgi:hypothetical protein
MAKQILEEKYSEKTVKCDFCPNTQAYGYTVETEDALNVIACCAACKRTHVPESKLTSFKRWLWPKDAATMRAELKAKK